MSARDTLELISKNNVFVCADYLKYCLVSTDKIPFKLNGEILKPNNINDFSSLHELTTGNNLDNYAGIGISIQGSGICAIDVDHCFKTPFDFDSIDERGKKVFELFKDIAYIEFSFSGTGLRVLFKHNIIENYSENYYIKNSNIEIEFYQPSKSYRYVTITGRSLTSNIIDFCSDLVLFDFLNTYMVKPVRYSLGEISSQKNDNKTIEELNEIVKYHYLTNNTFQNFWFGIAPGFGKDESERDYYIISYLYSNVTTDRNKIKELFENSPYFKTKDRAHIKKWTYNNNRYYNYIYSQLIR